MKRYLAKLIFGVRVDSDTEEAEFDEQIRIVESRNLEEAFYKARNIGHNEEELFSNTQQHQVMWKFIDVAELYAIETAKDGEQLYSNTHKTTEGDNFIQYIKQKSMEIQVKNLTFA